MGLVSVEADKPHLFQGVLHALGDFGRINPKILGAERHIVFHERRHNLVIGILEDHARSRANVIDVFRIARIEAINEHASLIGNKQGIHMLRERRFARTIAAKNADELPFCDIQAHAIEHKTLAVVGKAHA